MITQDRNMRYVSNIEEYRNLFFIAIIKKWEIIMKGKIIFVKRKNPCNSVYHNFSLFFYDGNNF